MVVVISNSQSLITTFVSTTQLQAIIPNTVLTTPSLLQLTVYTGSATVGSATVSVYSLAPPRVTAINPSYVLRPSTVSVVVTGSGLSGCDLLVDSPGFQVQSVSGTDTALTFSVVVGSDAVLGLRTITLSKASIGSSSSTVLLIDGGMWQTFNVPNAPARAYASVTTLIDGRILVAGGKDSAGQPTTSAGFVAPDLSWQDTTPLNVPRWGHQSILLGDGRVLVYGGSTIGGGTSSAEIFDPVTSSWSLAGFVRNTSTPPVLLPSGKVLLLPDEIYDPVPQTSTQINGATQLASSPGSSGFAGVLRDDASVYVAGGSTNGGTTLLAGVYTPSTDSTRAVSPISDGNVPSGYPILLPDGRIFVKVFYVVLQKFARADFFVYDFASDHYGQSGVTTVGAPLLLPTGKALVFGATSAETFDPSTNLNNPAAAPSFSAVPLLSTIAMLNDGRVLVGPPSLGVYSPAASTFSAPVTNSISIFDSRSNGDLTIRISGANFQSNSSVSCGGIPLRTLYVGAKSLFAFVPANVLAAASSQLVTVTNPGPGGGSSTPISIGANVQPVPPTISALTPSIGTQGTTLSAVASGTNLSGVTSVTFSGSGITGSIQTGATATQVPVSLTIASNATLGAHDVTVVTPGGSYTAASVFTVQVASNTPTTTPQVIPEVETGNIKVGYIVVSPDTATLLPLATVTYGIVQGGLAQSQAGVLPIPMTLDSSMYVGVVSGIGRNLGIAVSNPGSSASSLTLTLKDPTGNVQGNPVSITLQPGQQVSRFVNELYGSSAVGAGFTGSLRIQSASPFSLLGLLFSGAEFSTLPVASGSTFAGVPTRTLVAGSAANTPLAGTVGGANAVIIPQFAMGGGWATQIALVNPTSTVATGRVDIFDASGNPLAVKLNGSTQSTFTYSIAAGGTLLIAPRDLNGQSPF
jgi:hypothetical protein